MGGTRELDLQEFVDEIYEDYKYSEDSNYLFFLGAGCSKSSGIKLASELAEEWYEDLRRQKIKFDKFNIKNNISDDKEIDFGSLYFEIFEERFPSLLCQQKEIQNITEEKMPSLGYYVLSELMQLSQYNTVITTNFDNLIQDALIYSGNKRALVITHQDLAKFIDRNNTPLITKIHGDAHMHPFNNSDDTKEIPTELQSSIQGLFTNIKVIFIGYKGNDKSIAKLLQGCKRIDQVYWCSSSEPIGSELEYWWNSLRVKTHVLERDFDKIMNLIKSKFDLKAPDFKKRAEELESCYKVAVEEEKEDLKSIDDSEKTFIDYFLLGNTLQSQNNFEEACIAYSNAVKLDPKNSSSYSNWGLALERLGQEKKDISLYEQSIAKYNKAIELNSKEASTYFNLGIALVGLAKLNGDTALYEEGIENYKKAIELNPEKDSAYNNWGTALTNLADLNGDTALYKEGIKNFKKVIELNPEKDSAYNNWGTSLSSLAKTSNDITLYEESIEKYKKAIELNPKSALSYLNWGQTLCALANLKDDISLYEEAFEKYAKAIEMNPNGSAAYTGWGNGLSDLARLKSDVSLYEDSFIKYAKALEVNPNDELVYSSWGQSLFELAKISNSDEIYAQSLEKLKKSFELNGKSYNLSCYYSVMKDKQNALKYLEESLNNKEISIEDILKDDDWKNFKRDKDFKSLVNKYKK